MADGLESQIRKHYKKKKKRARRQPTGMKPAPYYTWEHDENLKGKIKSGLKKVGLK